MDRTRPDHRMFPPDGRFRPPPATRPPPNPGPAAEIVGSNEEAAASPAELVKAYEFHKLPLQSPEKSAILYSERNGGAGMAPKVGMESAAVRGCGIFLPFFHR